MQFKTYSAVLFACHGAFDNYRCDRLRTAAAAAPAAAAAADCSERRLRETGNEHA
jgi:hypothetical protein